MTTDLSPILRPAAGVLPVSRWAPATFEDGWCSLPERGSWIEVSVPFGNSFVVRGEKKFEDALMVVG